MEWGILGLIALIIGIAAGIVQVLDYLEKRRRKPEEPPPPPPPQPKIPHNLPQPGEFIGRKREKGQAREALASRSYLVCIDGIGGIGKTALALEAAYECLRASKGELPSDGIPTFDAFVWTTAKDRELALSDILDTIARTLDYPYIAQLPPEEKPSEAAKFLRAQKCLLIVDNFETITDDAVHDFLLNLPEPSKTLITSRHKLLRQAWDITLYGMEQDEALEFIRSEGKRLGLKSIETAEERAILFLHQATGGNPQAIRMSIGQIKYEGLSLDAILKRLYDARDGIFEYMFARDWELLSDDARCVLLVMPLFPSAASRAAIEAASNVQHFYFEGALKQLVEMSLIDTSDELDEAKQRHSIHPLTRSFAGAELKRRAEFEKEARLRAVNYFLNFAKQYGSEDWRIRDWQGYNMLETERENILASLDLCYNIGEWQMVVDFERALYYFLGERGYWQEFLNCGHQALEAARQLGDERAMAWVFTDALGWLYIQQDQYKEAETGIERALGVFMNLNDRRGIAIAKRLLGIIAREKNEFDVAQQLCQEALSIALQQGDEKVVADIHNSLGSLARQEGNYSEARRRYEEAKMIYEKVGYESGFAIALGNLGHAALKESRYDEARQIYERTLTWTSQNQKGVQLVLNEVVGVY